MSYPMNLPSCWWLLCLIILYVVELSCRVGTMMIFRWSFPVKATIYCSLVMHVLLVWNLIVLKPTDIYGWWIMTQSGLLSSSLSSLSLVHDCQRYSWEFSLYHFLTSLIGCTQRWPHSCSKSSVCRKILCTRTDCIDFCLNKRWSPPPII